MAFGDDILAGMPQIPNMDPINASLAANALKPNPTPAAPAYKAPSFIQNVLGALGDALLVANGHQAAYAPTVAERKRSAFLSNYLGQIDPSLGQMVAGGADPADALAIYKIQHPDQPDFIREMKAAGIDPTSDEGKGMLRQHIGGVGPADMQEYEYAKGQGFSGSFMDFLNQKAGPLIANNGDGTFTLVPRAMTAPAATSAAPSAAVEYLKAHPETASQFDQKYGAGASAKALGGATASTPSPTFR